MMGVRHLCVALMLALLAVETPVHAEPKAKPDSTCRSAGVLKFDPETRPRQRVRGQSPACGSLSLCGVPLVLIESYVSCMLVQSKGMEVCSKYRKSTCCDASHANPLRMYEELAGDYKGGALLVLIVLLGDRKIREPVVAKFGHKCQRLTEEMACSSCHPLMGTWEMKNVCPGMCNDWYDACKDEYYSYGGAGTLAPCYGNALVCSPLKTIADSGADFCQHMGFHVGGDADVEGVDCFDGSVPEQLGEAEPTEPWTVRVRRMLEEEAENPSGLFIAGVFVVITMLLMGGRIARQLGDPFGGDQLNLMEVRRLQQERYERGEQMYEDETDSSSDEELPPLSAFTQAGDESGNTTSASS
jgi:hypothetical protein